MALTAINPSGVSTAFIYRRDTGSGLGPGRFVDADPGNVNTPIIFEPDCDLTGDKLEVWIVVSGASPNWGGAEVWGSTDPAGNFGVLGTVFGSPQGVLTANFASGSDPDISNTLTVDLTESRGTITPGTRADADAHLTLCYCGGELIAYSAATLTSQYHYRLDTYIRRGLYKTAISSHAVGSAFARITPAVFRFGYPKSLIGTTIYFKFTSFNGLGAREQDLADVTAYPYVLTGAGLCGLPWFQQFSVGGEFADLTIDEWDGNYEIFDVQMPVDITFATGFAGSPVPGCEVAPATNVTLTFQRISNTGNTVVPIASLTIVAGQKLGSFVFLGPMTIVAGDRLRLYADSGVDATIAGLFGTIVGMQPK